MRALADERKRDIPFVAVVREVAPTKWVKNDDGPRGLGVGAFQRNYFGGHPIFWDETQGFVKSMGNRLVSFGFKASWWKPWEIWSEVTENMQTLKDEGIEGNFAGDGLIQGGTIVIGPGGQGVTFAHFEDNELSTGLPVDSIVEAVERLEFGAS